MFHAIIVQATVSVIPAASSLILKALNEPARDRKKVSACDAPSVSEVVYGDNSSCFWAFETPYVST